MKKFIEIERDSDRIKILLLFLPGGFARGCIRETKIKKKHVRRYFCCDEMCGLVWRRGAILEEEKKTNAQI